MRHLNRNFHFVSRSAVKFVCFAADVTPCVCLDPQVHSVAVLKSGRGRSKKRVLLTTIKTGRSFVVNKHITKTQEEVDFLRGYIYIYQYQGRSLNVQELTTATFLGLIYDPKNEMGGCWYGMHIYILYCLSFETHKAFFSFFGDYQRNL